MEWRFFCSFLRLIWDGLKGWCASNEQVFCGDKGGFSLREPRLERTCDASLPMFRYKLRFRFSSSFSLETSEAASEASSWRKFSWKDENRLTFWLNNAVNAYSSQDDLVSQTHANYCAPGTGLSKTNGNNKTLIDNSSGFVPHLFFFSKVGWKRWKAL